MSSAVVEEEAKVVVEREDTSLIPHLSSPHKLIPSLLARVALPRQQTNKAIRGTIPYSVHKLRQVAAAEDLERL